MVKTGYISFITESGGGFDANGNVLSPTKSFSDYFECNLKTVTKELQFIVDGQYIQAKYSIYIDADLLGDIDLETVNSISLRDNNSNDLGEFQIHNKEYLNLTKRIKIIV